MPPPTSDVASRPAPVRRPPQARRAGEPPAPRGPRSYRPKSRAQQARRWFAVVLAFFALILASVAAWGFYQFRRIDRVDVDLAKAEDLSPQNFLVVGSDTRDLGDDERRDVTVYGNGSERAPDGKRADTMVIARVDPKKASVELLSIPRDLWVDRGTTEGRINAAYNDGAQALVDTIESNLDIPIHHYVEVNFNGFKGLVDALQGVPLYFDKPVRDKMTGLYVRKAGCYTLNGHQALAFARSRHLEYSNGVRWVADPTADLGRITRQQIFLRHAMKKVTGLGLGSVDSLRVLVGVAVNNVTIDDQMGTDDMMRLARHFEHFDADTMVVHRLETENTRTTSGQSILEMSPQGSQAVLDIFNGRVQPTRADAPATTAVEPSMVTVEVMNGAGVPGLARAGSAELGTLGFTIGTVGDAEEPTDVTTITYGKGGEAASMLVSSKIAGNPPPTVDPTLPAGMVRVTLGEALELAGATPAGASATAGPPTSGAGSVTPEEPIGVEIGDPPPGVACG